MSPPLSRRERWAWSSAVSVVAHGIVLPLLVYRLMQPPPAEIEITYLGDPETPSESSGPLPPEPTPVPEQAPPSKSPDDPSQKPPDEPKQKDEPPPDPEKRKEKEKKKEPETPPLEAQLIPHLKMVNQEQFPDEEENKNARFLAQKNHKVDTDTQAERRNLIREQAGQPAAEPPTTQTKEREKPGEEKQRVAQLEDQPGDPKRLPTGAPPPVEAEQQRTRTSPLAMRQAVEAASTPTSTPELPVGADGIPIQARTLGPEGPKSLAKVLPSGEKGPTSGSPMRLNHHDYDRIVGFDVSENERRIAALGLRSTAPGHWDKVLARQDILRSSLENFTPGVRIGNQSELGTAAHPFAAFIADMHRQIHHFWGDGFLANIDRGSGRAYAPDLVTAIEIRLNDEGKVTRTVIVKPSGNLPFDVAAMDSVTAAAPFPVPPDSIKSRDGNVYLTWRFHRDERQCATDFVSAHKLNTPPAKEPAKPAPLPTPSGPSSEKSRLAALLPTPSASSGGAGGSGAASGSGSGDGGKEKSSAASNAKGTKTPPGGLKAVPEEAQKTGEKWLAAYAKSDVRWLAGTSAVPFNAGGKVVADDSASLRAFYESMLSEGVAKSDRAAFYTMGELEKKRGRVPKGADAEMVFAWVEFGGDDMVLLLEQTERGWRVVGLER